MLEPIRLKRAVASNTSADLDDVLALKTYLHARGYYEAPEWGLTPYPDDALITAIESYQRANGLKVDGAVKLDGETLEAIHADTRAKAQELQAKGRNGDTLLAHITPEEALWLHNNTDGGSINPETGLLEFYTQEMRDIEARVNRSKAKERAGLQSQIDSHFSNSGNGNNQGPNSHDGGNNGDNGAAARAAAEAKAKADAAAAAEQAQQERQQKAEDARAKREQDKQDRLNRARLAELAKNDEDDEDKSILAKKDKRTTDYNDYKTPNAHTTGQSKPAKKGPAMGEWNEALGRTMGYNDYIGTGDYAHLDMNGRPKTGEDKARYDRDVERERLAKIAPDRIFTNGQLDGSIQARKTQDKRVARAKADAEAQKQRAHMAKTAEVVGPLGQVLSQNANKAPTPQTGIRTASFTDEDTVSSAYAFQAPAPEDTTTATFKTTKAERIAERARLKKIAPNRTFTESQIDASIRAGKAQKAQASGIQQAAKEQEAIGQTPGRVPPPPPPPPALPPKVYVHRQQPNNPFNTENAIPNGRPYRYQNKGDIEIWDLPPALVPPNGTGDIRQPDDWAKGGSNWGDSRTGHHHRGVDFVTKPGDDIKASVGGKVVGIGYPYGAKPSKGGVVYRTVDIETPDGFIVRHFYVSPSLKVGDKVKAGETVLGTSQDLTKKYDKRMTNHVHVEIRDPRIKAYPNAGSKYTRMKDIRPTISGEPSQ